MFNLSYLFFQIILLKNSIRFLPAKSLILLLTLPGFVLFIVLSVKIT